MSHSTPENGIPFEDPFHRAWEIGRATRPQVPLSADVFRLYLAERLPKVSKGRTLTLLLEQLPLADLYLACACLHEVSEALKTLEEHYLAKLPAALARFNHPAQEIDEVCQKLRIHLLLGTSGWEPQLARYDGQGSLQNWLWIIVTRMLNKPRSPVQKTLEQDARAALEALPSPGPDPEFDVIQRRYSREFRLAVREAFAALSKEQRYLLRLHFIHRLSTTEMARAFQVNQSTTSRWLKSAREAVYEETKRRFQEKLGLSSQEFASLLISIKSQLDLSVSQLLKEEPA